MYHILRRAFPFIATILCCSACALPGLPSQPAAPSAAPAPTALPASPTPLALATTLEVETSGFSLRHPAGWVTQNLSGTLTLAPTEESMARTSPGPDLVITIDVTPADLVVKQYGDDALDNPEIFFEVSSGVVQQSGYSISPTMPLTVGGRSALAADLSGAAGAGRLIVIVGPDQIMRILGQADVAGWEAQRELFMAVVATMSYFTPTATPMPSATPLGEALQPDLLRQGPPGFVLRIGGSAGSRDARFFSARGLAVAPDGTLYMVDSSRGIWVFAPDGDLISTFGNEEILEAYDIVRTSAGDLFVADYGRNAVARFRPDGTFVERWGSAGDKPEQFGLSSPQRIALGPDEHIYALDSRPGNDGNVTSSVVIFSSAGKLIERVTIPADLAPADLAVDARGNIYLAETFGGAVIKLAPDGSELARFGDPLAEPSLAAGAIDLDERGDIYLATYGAGVVRLSPSGVIVAQVGKKVAEGSVPAAGEFNLPNGLAVGPADVVWVSDNSGEYSAVTALRLSSDPAVVGTMTAQEQTAVVEATPVPEAQLLHQWAATATASSFYPPDYDAQGATGPPDVPACQDSPDAWAAATPNGIDTLELSYTTPVFATSLTIHQNTQPGFISKVELVDERGEVIPVYSAAPTLNSTCPFAFPITFAQTLSRIVKVRITLDQRGGTNWSEIDAVELVGLP